MKSARFLPQLFFPILAISLVAGCATSPPASPGAETGEAIANPDVGFDGYRLPLIRGYTILSRERLDANPLLRDWLPRWEEGLERLGVEVEYTDDVFIRYGNRIVRFSVGEEPTPIPLSHLPADRRRIVLQRVAKNEEFLAQRREVDLLAFNRFEEIGGTEVMRTDLVDSGSYERVGFLVPGRLNEYYRFSGRAFRNEGAEMEDDIRAMIEQLAF